MQVQMVFVTSTSPLLVTERGAATAIPAMVGHGSSYSPVLGDAVLAVFDPAASRFVVLVGAVS